jgi:hypothetical protein
MNSNFFNLNLTDKIMDIYENQSFLERYGEYVFVSIIICISFILLVTYIHIKINITKIRADWTNQKCKPNIMPFAGMINAPPNMSKMEYAEKNFAECTQNILTDISEMALIPIHYTISIITAIIGEILKIINDMRELVDKIRKSVKDITSNIMSRILNIMTPLIETIITTKSLVGKSNGVLTAIIYTLSAFLSFFVIDNLSYPFFISHSLIHFTATPVPVCEPFAVSIQKILHPALYNSINRS